MNTIEKIKNKLHRDGFFALLLAMLKYPYTRKKRAAYQNMLSETHIADRFSKIYDDNLWSSDESLSGSGSEVAYTESLRAWMISSLPKMKIKRFVDAPCGDFNWMRLVVKEIELDYTGLDIVPSVIETNVKKFSDMKTNFAVLNICEDDIPACDMIMVRDCLFHLSFEDINKFLKNLSSTDYEYLLTTSHIVENSFKNTDIITGDFRLIDIFKPPFVFDESKIIERVKDYPDGYPTPRDMILIKKRDVPTALSSS